MKGFFVFPVLLIHLLGTPAIAGPYGEYFGPVKSEWLDDGRKMKLLDDFRFIDSDQIEWLAPAGSITARMGARTADFDGIRAGTIVTHHVR